jgi:hypothetical protein
VLRPSCCVLRAAGSSELLAAGVRLRRSGRGELLLLLNYLQVDGQTLTKKKRSHLGTESTPTVRHKLPRYELR